MTSSDVELTSLVHIQMEPKHEEQLLQATGHNDVLLPTQHAVIYNGHLPISFDKPEISAVGSNTRRMIKKSMRLTINSETYQLKKIVLKSSVLDPSMIKERLSGATMRSVGVPASRSAYAMVFINGKSRGLYVMLEDDHEEYLSSRFPVAGGPRCGPSWVCSPTNNEGVRSLLHIIRNTTQIPQWIEKVPAAFDLKMYSRTLVAEIVTSNWDGFWNRNNFVTYQDPVTKVFHTFRTDLDLSFGFSYGRDTNFTAITAESWADKAIPFSQIYKVEEWTAYFNQCLQDTLKLWFYPGGPVEAYAKVLHQTALPAVLQDDYFALDSGWSRQDMALSLETFPAHTNAPGILPFIAMRHQILKK